eukprot:COSAG03_NODE_208_length_10612_cov_35.757158_10_plen_96_part_00
MTASAHECTRIFGLLLAFAPAKACGTSTLPYGARSPPCGLRHGMLLLASPRRIPRAGASVAVQGQTCATAERQLYYSRRLLRLYSTVDLEIYSTV